MTDSDPQLSEGLVDAALRLAGIGERRVYVAGSTKDLKRVKAVQRLVRARGWDVTFDWTSAEGNFPDGGWDAFPERGAQIALNEIGACVDADLMILLCPPVGLGCWIEMGAALATGAEVWVVEPHRDSIFWQHPNVRRFPTFSALEDALSPAPVEGGER